MLSRLHCGCLVAVAEAYKLGSVLSLQDLAMMEVADKRNNFFHY